jgi:hypothetical protein
MLNSQLEELAEDTMQIAILRAKCKQSFFEFFKLFWHSIENAKLAINWHHEFLCNICENAIKNQLAFSPQNILINIPPSTAKSTIISQMFPIWAWLNQPHLCFLCASSEKALTLHHSKRCKDVISSKLFSILFPEIWIRKDINGAVVFQNNFGGVRRALTVGGATTGFHGDILLSDDIQMPNKATKLYLKQTNEWLSETFFSRGKNPTSAFWITVMQRIHANDASDYLLNELKLPIFHVNLPSENLEQKLGRCEIKPIELRKFYDLSGGYLDLNRLSPDILEKKEKEMTPLLYATQYLQRPISADGLMFKYDSFPIILRSEVRFQNIIYHYTIDSAEGKNSSSDFTACLRFFEYKGKMYIDDILKIRGGFIEQTNLILDFIKQKSNHNTRVYIEQASTGSSLLSIMKDIKYKNINKNNERIDASFLEFDYSYFKTTIKHNTHKTEKTKAIQIFVHRKDVILIKDHYTEDFLNEACTFPEGKNDDAVDCMRMACNVVFLPRQSIF